ncbi:MAG TPA: arsenate reductase (azurin) large subunit [Chloroflexi bacterium]|nr:arsenate reductase (azurin) large subunit [Chloroflexota bacterium]
MAEDTYTPQDSVPLPPPDANVHTTACDYCIVGCGYKVYTWPVGEEGGPAPDQNALGSPFPGSVLGPWISPNQHNIVMVDGRPHHAVVVPDFQATVVNKGGNHSIRGGTLALKCYNPETPTRDRLLYPQIRVNGELTRVDWDTALDVMAAVSEHVLRNYGESAWAMKTYSYEFFENTYAITKLAFASIGTPAYAPHDKPGSGNDTAGVDDSGIITFSASYQDWADADVIYISGTDPFETKTIVFTSWMMGGPKLIMALPRRTAGVAYAEANGGLFLQVIPGTDTLLHLAISRIILENGWEDKEFIEEWIASKWEIEMGMGRGTRNTPWQWRTTWGQFGTDFEGYREWLLNYEPAELANAAEVTGVPAEKIQQVAEMLTGGGGPRPKASFGFEKGNYWSNNYLNTASFAAMGLLCGAGNRPGQVISRLGGHQRGWIGAASYPREKSPEKLPGRRKVELDLDRWVEAGNVRFAWVIGTTWTAAMAASQEFARRFRELTVENPHQITSLNKQDIINTLIARVDSGGMVVVDSDIYIIEPLGTEIADIVLPAAAWGEHDAARCNGERRLRLYSKFYDPPGEAKPDWWAISRFAQRMGFEGYDWHEDNDVFEEAARFSRGKVLDYNVLVWYARQQGKKGHEVLRELGTEGIQTPIRWVNGQMVGTVRLHDSTLELGPPEGPTVHSKWLTHFKTQSGKALLIKSPWELFSDFYERIKPDPEKGELWLTNGRINEIWQSAFDDIRKPYIKQRWPDTFVEIHPDDAAQYGIESGDEVRLFSDDILIQTGGWIRVRGDEYNFTTLMEQGLIRAGSGDVRAIAIVTADVRPGVLFANFLHPADPANSLVHRVPDPITNRYRFKLGKAQIERIGESPYKNAFEQMSLKPRTASG